MKVKRIAKQRKKKSCFEQHILSIMQEESLQHQYHRSQSSNLKNRTCFSSNTSKLSKRKFIGKKVIESPKKLNKGRRKAVFNNIAFLLCRKSPYSIDTTDCTAPIWKIKHASLVIPVSFHKEKALNKNKETNKALIKEDLVIKKPDYI